MFYNHDFTNREPDDLEGLPNLGTNLNFATTATDALNNATSALLYFEMSDELALPISARSDSLSLLEEVCPLCPSYLLYST